MTRASYGGGDPPPVCRARRRGEPPTRCSRTWARGRPVDRGTRTATSSAPSAPCRRAPMPGTCADWRSLPGPAVRVVRGACYGLEADAAPRGWDRVVLDAVVERGNPPFYARLGYRTARYLPDPDKPLSEDDGTPARGAARARRPPASTGRLAEGAVVGTGLAAGESRPRRISRPSGPDEVPAADRRAKRPAGRCASASDAWARRRGARDGWREMLATHADTVERDSVHGDRLIFAAVPRRSSRPA